MKYSSHKETNKAVRALVRLGWSYKRGSKHGKLRPPTGRSTVIVAGTPSCGNAIKIFYGNIKRAKQG